MGKITEPLNFGCKRQSLSIFLELNSNGNVFVIDERQREGEKMNALFEISG